MRDRLRKLTLNELEKLDWAITAPFVKAGGLLMCSSGTLPFLQTLEKPPTWWYYDECIPRWLKEWEKEKERVERPIKEYNAMWPLDIGRMQIGRMRR